MGTSASENQIPPWWEIQKICFLAGCTTRLNLWKVYFWTALEHDIDVRMIKLPQSHPPFGISNVRYVFSTSAPANPLHFPDTVRIDTIKVFYTPRITISIAMMLVSLCNSHFYQKTMFGSWVTCKMRKWEGMKICPACGKIMWPSRDNRVLSHKPP